MIVSPAAREFAQSTGFTLLVYADHPGDVPEAILSGPLTPEDVAQLARLAPSAYIKPSEWPADGLEQALEALRDHHIDVWLIEKGGVLP